MLVQQPWLAARQNAAMWPVPSERQRSDPLTGASNPLLCSIEVRATPAKRVRTRKLLYMRGRVRELKFPTPRPTDAEGNLLPEHHRAPTKKKKRRGKS